MPSSTGAVRYGITARIFGRVTTCSITNIEELLPWLNTSPPGEVISVTTVKLDCPNFWQKYQDHIDGVR